MMNKALGADGMVVNAGGLTMDRGTLLETCRQYWNAGRLDDPAHFRRSRCLSTRAVP
ncbi:hypothetical protein ACU4GH_06050 [Bradyrhizobium betae]